MSDHQEKMDFATELAQAKHKAGTLGLWKTMHALEEAVTAVGWEIAEQMEGEGEA